MKHIHSVYDTDSHFSISPITRAIKNESSKKTTVMQYDHNSERFTFEMPRYIEGHDMTLCNKVELHYINVASDNSGQSKGVYGIDDLQTSPEDENVVICSWLISKKATKHAGTLNFRLRFACVDENAKVVYAWHTEIFKNVSVSNGIDNAEVVIEDYSDILEAWKQEIFATFDEALADFDKALSDMAGYDGKLEELSSSAAALESSVTKLKTLHTDFIHTVYPTEAQKAKKDMRGWYRIAETTKAGYWSNIVHLQVEVLRSGRSSDVIFTVERMNYQDSPSIGVLSYGNQTDAYKAVDNLRVVYVKGKSGEKSYLEVHINQNASPDDAWNGKGDSTGYKFTVETHLHSKTNWNLITPILVSEKVEAGWTSYEKSPSTSAWSQVTASVDDINNLATKKDISKFATTDFVEEQIDGATDEINKLIASNEAVNELKALVDVIHPTQQIPFLDFFSEDRIADKSALESAMNNAITYDFHFCNMGAYDTGNSNLPKSFWHSEDVKLDVKILPDYIGALEGNVVKIDASLREGSSYKIKNISATRGVINFNHYTINDEIFSSFVVSLDFTWTVLSPQNEEIEETLPYDFYYDIDFAQIDGEITVSTNNGSNGGGSNSGDSIIVDSNLSKASLNPVQNRVITSKFEEIEKKLEDAADVDPITVDSELSTQSENPVQNKVIAAALQNKANADHSHGVSDINGLNDALNDKSDSNHTHDASDIEGLGTALANKADTNHSHGISDVEGLATALNNKADANHTHEGLVTVDTALSETSTNPVQNKVIAVALKGKAEADHTHDFELPIVPIEKGGTGGTTAKEARDNLGITKELENLFGKHITSARAYITTKTHLGMTEYYYNIDWTTLTEPSKIEWKNPEHELAEIPSQYWSSGHYEISTQLTTPGETTLIITASDGTTSSVTLSEKNNYEKYSSVKNMFPIPNDYSSVCAKLPEAGYYYVSMMLRTQAEYLNGEIGTPIVQTILYWDGNSVAKTPKAYVSGTHYSIQVETTGEVMAVIGDDVVYSGGVFYPISWAKLGF